MGPDNSALGQTGQSLQERLSGALDLRLVVGVIVLGITASEALLYTDRMWASVWGTLLTLLFYVAVLQRGEGLTTVQVFALVPLFRIVNLGMPVFFQLTAYWFPLIYGRLIPALVYVDSLDRTVPVDFNLTRGLALAPLALLLGALLAEVESIIIQTDGLIPTWSIAQLLMITVVMVCFVGFVEEYLFCGLLQRTLQTTFGRWPGLLIASGVFGLMHAGYGIPAEILFAGLIGLVYGLLYDYTDSLVFVTLAHGFLNVFLFAVFPIHGSVLF